MGLIMNLISRFTVNGTGAADTILSNQFDGGQAAFLNGFGGDDVIQVTTDPSQDYDFFGIRVSGGGGDDVLIMDGPFCDDNGDTVRVSARGGAGDDTFVLTDDHYVDPLRIGRFNGDDKLVMSDEKGFDVDLFQFSETGLANGEILVQVQLMDIVGECDGQAARLSNFGPPGNGNVLVDIYDPSVYGSAEEAIEDKLNDGGYEWFADHLLAA